MTYPNEVKAQALALGMQGYSAPRIERQLATITDEVPTERTIQLWMAELRLSSDEQDSIIIENARQIARRAQRLILDTLETMEPDPKQLANLNIVAGTAVDKIHAAKSIQRGPDIHQHLTLLIQEAKLKLQSGDGAEPINEAALPRVSDIGANDEPKTVDVTSICIDSDQL